MVTIFLFMRHFLLRNQRLQFNTNEIYRIRKRITFCWPGKEHSNRLQETDSAHSISIHLLVINTFDVHKQIYSPINHKPTSWMTSSPDHINTIKITTTTKVAGICFLSHSARHITSGCFIHAQVFVGELLINFCNSPPKRLKNRNHCLHFFFFFTQLCMHVTSV